MKNAEIKEAERKRKHKKRFRVIIEIAFMVLGILCSIMPYPFPLLVPIGIGAIRIISNAVQREKEPETQPIVYCNGTREPHTKEKPKTQITKKRAATSPTQAKPVKAKTVIQAESKQRRKTKAQ